MSYSAVMRFVVISAVLLLGLFAAGGACDAESPTGEGEGEEGEGEGEGEGDCVTDNDCVTSGEVCLGTRDPANTDLLLRTCAATVGNDVIGQQCTVNAAQQCASGLCGGNPSLCTHFCAAAADCALNQTCGTVNLSIEGRAFSVSACVAGADGQLVCANDAACAARGQTCSEVALIGGLLTPICGHPPGGDVALGGFCDALSLENPTQCASGFCDDADIGQCIDICQSDADCAPDLICTDSHLGNVTGRWCAEPCATMDDCGFDAADVATRVCKRRCDDNDPVSPAFELVCTPPVGTLDTGEALGGGQSALNCKSGLSVTTGGVTYCSQPCATGTDCPTFDNAGSPAQMTCNFDSETLCAAAPDSFLYCRRP